jgi:hypothetical protein
MVYYLKGGKKDLVMLKNYLTTAYRVQSLKAVLSKPVKALRNELPAVSF